MDRRSIIKHAGIAGVLAAGVAPAVHAQATIRWQMASSFPRSLDIMFGGGEVFAKQVRTMSGGKFEVVVHPAGELIHMFGVVDGIQLGQIEMTHTQAYNFHGKDDTFSLGTGIPFGLNSRQMTAWTYHGNGLKLMREFYAKWNMIHFPGGSTGAQMGGWFGKEIKSVQDLKGLKFRMGGYHGKVLQRLGVIPTNIPGGQTLAALQNKTIDAVEWVGPHDDLKFGFNKVAPYYYYPGWWEGGRQLDFYIGQKAYDALSAENKAIVEAAAAYAHADMQAKYDALNPVALKQMVATGTQLRAFPMDVMNVAYKDTMALYAELSAKNESWRKIYADFSKFRDEQNFWFGLAEGKFDSFMQALKV